VTSELLPENAKRKHKASTLDCIVDRKLRANLHQMRFTQQLHPRSDFKTPYSAGFLAHYWL
jgi:hypothetical protein